MILAFKKLFKKDNSSFVDANGYTHEVGKIPHKHTPTRLEVDPKAALESSLRQMGSGIKLSAHLAEELAWRLKQLEEEANSDTI